MTVTDPATFTLFARPRWRLSRVQRRALLLALGMALLWWLVALWVRSTDLIPVWYDQEHVFLSAASQLADPFQVPGFINPPWAAVVLVPFSLLPAPLAVLAQFIILCVALALVVLHFGGSFRAVTIALTSFFAFDNALQLNIDWLTVAGLLVPVAWSGPLLLVKPQGALGYYAGFRPRAWLKAAAVSGVWLLLSLLLWGWWPEKMLLAIQSNLVGQPFNLAPVVLLPAPISIAVGVGLLLWAFRRRDPVIGIFGWLFFVPYLKFYSLFLPFALACARWPRVALLISGVMWLVYGSIIGSGLLGF